MSEQNPLTEDQLSKIADIILDRFVERFRLNVGKSILDKAWTLIVSIGLAFVLYVVATQHKFP